jgi:hypothetical protein
MKGMQTVTLLKDATLRGNHMGMEFIHGLNLRVTKESGTWEPNKEKVNGRTVMVIVTLESGNTQR